MTTLHLLPATLFTAGSRPAPLTAPKLRQMRYRGVPYRREDRIAPDPVFDKLLVYRGVPYRKAPAMRPMPPAPGQRRYRGVTY